MKMSSGVLGVLSVAVAAATLAAEPAAWRSDLALPGDGSWRQRVRVTVRNDSAGALAGWMAAVPVGREEGQIDLVGQSARSVRVCDGQGQELVFGLTAADGSPERGTLQAGSTLGIPVECPAGKSAEFFVYFDNPSAGPVPDWFDARFTLANGGLEEGAGDTPIGWRHDAADATHRATWSDESPHSGRRCLQTVVAEGAEPTWIATRQGDIQIVGGARYRMRAWVRGQNVKGMAGWYIHVGNADKPMMLSPMASAGEGTFDWKEVSAEFTAPDDADTADLGTVLRGTGTAWFDDVSLQRLDEGRVSVAVDQAERLELAEVGGSAPWPPGGNWPLRAKVIASNTSSEARGDALVAVPAGMLMGRMRGRLDPASLRVECAGQVVKHYLCGETLLLADELPARTVKTYCVYLGATATPAAPSPTDYAALVASERNLLDNGDFEQGAPLPTGWNLSGGSVPGVTWSVQAASPFGKGRSIQMEVAADTPKGWRGWTQSAPVQPGRTYLLAGMVRTRDVKEGEARIHIHLHNAQDGLVAAQAMSSIGPGVTGTSDWTLLSGLVTTPADAATLMVHLTMDPSGTLGHDGVCLAEVVPSTLPVGQAFEGPPLAAEEPLQAWPVNAVVKVFPEDAPPAEPVSARITLARGEQEPLQLALRSGRAVENLTVECAPLAGPGGAKLAVQSAVVGYVPIDYPTSYYSSRAARWVRKLPTGSPGCDGWPGQWPDPLVPGDRLALSANRTRAVWLTFSADEATPAGDFAGIVRLSAGGKTLAELPVSAHVWNFALPAERHLAATYDVRFGPDEGLWGKSLEEFYPDIVRFLAERRLSPDAVQPAPRIEYRDGKVEADFTEFDRAAAWYFDELKIPFSYTPGYFYLFGWGHPPRACFGEEPYPGERPFEGVDRSQLRPEFKRAYQACLKAFWDHLREKGWQDRFVLYISDEPFDHHEHIRTQMKALCAMIHEVDPKIPIYSSTWHHQPAWDDALDIWGVGHYGVVPTEKLAEIRSRGGRIWFTTDGQMCTDTPFCAVERLLPHYCFQYGAQAYEFWGVSWHTYNPYAYGWHKYIWQTGEPGDSYWIRYPNGDGFLIYPGGPIGRDGIVSSIRLEQAREGVEDYETLWLLRERIASSKTSGRDTAAAEQALADAARLVTIPNAGGRYSSKILPDPDAVLRAKEAVSRAVEALGD